MDEKRSEEGVETGKENREVGEARVVDLYWWVRLGMFLVEDKH